MTFQEFIEQHNGQYLEVAGSSAQNQCVDLANGYLRDVLNHSIVEFTNARDFPSKLTDFDWIQKTPDGVPQEGDIVVWQNTTNGHIAVFIEGNANSFRSFDENYPTGSPCHVQNHTYIDAMCWGRPKASMQSVLDEVRKERDNNWNLYQEEVSKNNDLTKENQDIQQQLQNLREAFDKQTEADADTGKQLVEVSQERDGLKGDIQSIADALSCGKDLKSILTAIHGLIEAPVKPVEPKPTPEQGLLEAIIQWLKSLKH